MWRFGRHGKTLFKWNESLANAESGVAGSPRSA